MKMREQSCIANVDSFKTHTQLLEEYYDFVRRNVADGKHRDELLSKGVCIYNSYSFK